MILHAESKKKKDTNELIYKIETDSQTQRAVTRGIEWEFEIDTYTMLYLKQITNKDLLYSTGNSAQYSVVTQMGKGFLKKNRYMYMHN